MQKQARLIAVTHPKGGVGKTTTTMVLSAQLAEQGYKVLVADCDAQASASAWANAAPEGKPFSAAVVNLSAYAGKVHREIQKQLDNYDFIIVDCPPGLDALSPQSVLLVADLVIVPMPPSPADLWACLGAIRLIERGTDLNPALIARLLPNRVVRTSLSNAIMRELAEFGIPLMSSRLTNRTAYQEAVVSGVSVSALGRDAKAAKDEVSALANEVLALLGECK
jgi:chromosome partitioning protein